MEAKLNALPQFVTKIDGVDIQFVHVRSRHPNAMPLIMTHGWPGSIFELLKVIGPLTDPTAYGGRAEDAFDLVLPSLPGYGFSGKPQGTGWDPDHVARAWAELMGRLGYKRYVSQGGDWGAIVSHAMGRQAPCWRDGLSRQDLPCATKLGRAYYHKLIYWHEVEKGGHFAAFEQPELFTDEIRAAFRSLR